MTRTPLTRHSKPFTTPEYELQATEAARKRRAQMIPGNAPPTAPGEDPVSHYQGAVKEVVLGPVPQILSEQIKEQSQSTRVGDAGADSGHQVGEDR